MKILVLGGTGFLGSHIVDALTTRGHVPTLFNRGKTHPQRFRYLETIQGDRDPNVEPGLTGLRERTWDAVIDTSGYVPRIVKASAEMLATCAGQYVFISSRSAYQTAADAGADENAPLAMLQDSSLEEVNGETYGALKAASEQAAEAAMPGRVVKIRAGLIVGPRDESDRFTYWPARVARGGEVLAPGDGKSPVQFIDARDLARFIVMVVEKRLQGAFNVLGPAEELSFSGMLEACKAAAASLSPSAPGTAPAAAPAPKSEAGPPAMTEPPAAPVPATESDSVTPPPPGSPATFTWVDQKFLLDREVKPWSEIPMWIPNSPADAGFMRTSNAKALAAGLKLRPVVETARDTLEWFRGGQKDPASYPWKAGLTAERERSILDAWHDYERKSS